jgi:hypothetical protein
MPHLLCLLQCEPPCEPSPRRLCLLCTLITPLTMCLPSTNRCPELPQELFCGALRPVKVGWGQNCRHVPPLLLCILRSNCRVQFDCGATKKSNS